VDVQRGAPVAYAWRRNGQPIAGATHRTLEIHGVTPAQTGTYTVVVSGPCASTTSAGAALTLCAADFNCDGGVNSQDFFDYLAAFFAGSPEADFDHDGTVNSQDFFGFVGAFFAGCG
jgi:hypothetical protein